MEIGFKLLLVVFLLLCLFMSGLILIQRGRGGGLASAFGGAGGNTAFGSKTGDVLTWTTAIVFLLFMLMAIALNRMAENIHETRVRPSADATPALPAGPSDAPTRVVPIDDIPATTPDGSAAPQDAETNEPTSPTTDTPTESAPATQP